MSNVQRRIKSIYKVPLIDMTESNVEPPFNDPRSPSANVSRTPVDLNTYHIPNPQTRNNLPINSTR
ncbi:hypothetical protein I4U23_008048 [Adineta vaga]|nr:hypothetical protein I4U23_008048 [Adineta vaga]